MFFKKKKNLSIQEKIKNLDESKSFYEQKLYPEILIDLYEMPEVYVGLSQNDYDPTTDTSTPGIFTKDGFPAIYVFTDEAYMKPWKEHYRLQVGKISKAEGFDVPYVSLYQIARARGAERVFVDEGQKFLCFPIKDLFELAGAHTKAEFLPTEEENRTGWVPESQEDFRFNRCKVLR